MSRELSFAQENAFKDFEVKTSMGLIRVKVIGYFVVFEGQCEVLIQKYDNVALTKHNLSNLTLEQAIEEYGDKIKLTTNTAKTAHIDTIDIGSLLPLHSESHDDIIQVIKDVFDMEEEVDLNSSIEGQDLSILIGELEHMFFITIDVRETRDWKTINDICKYVMANK